MSTYLLITPKDDELYHYGVRGMKWGVRKAHSMDTTATTASGGASIYEIEEAEKEAQDELDRQKALNEYFTNKKGMTPAQRAFHEGTTKRSAKKISDRIEAGRRKVEQIRRMAKELGLELSHSDEEVLTAVMQMTEDDLEHHGIKGQKWGVRRFQNKDGTRTKAGKDRAKYIRERGLSDEKKLSKKGWKTGSNMLVGEVDRQRHEWEEEAFTGQLKSPTYKVRDILSKGEQGLKSIAFTDYDAQFTDFDSYDLGKVNPNFGEPGTTQNCAKCTVATELAKYGVSVPAGRQAFPSSSDAMSYWFDGAHKETQKIDAMEETIRGYGNGASGSISGYYPNGNGGHCMHFSVSNGEVHIQDGQNGRRFTSIREAAEAYGFDTNEPMTSFRLDTATPNWDHLHEDSVLSTPYARAKRWTVDWNDNVYSRF